MPTLQIVLLSQSGRTYSWFQSAYLNVRVIGNEKKLHEVVISENPDVIVVEEGISYQGIRNLPCVCLLEEATEEQVDEYLSLGFDDVWSQASIATAEIIARCQLVLDYRALILELEEERDSTVQLIEAIKSGKIDRIPSDDSPSGVIRLIDDKLLKENSRLLKHIEKKNKLLEGIAHFDPLTDLPNRRQFHKALKREVARAHRHRDLMALLFIDLDKFKTINDTMGHDVGDELLQEVASRLQDCIRDEDLVCRIAGDEFAIIMSDIKQTYNAGKVAQKVVNQLNTPFHLNGKTLHISGSVGIACYPYAGEDYESLSKHADIAMYTAKESGRNNYQYFTKELNGAHIKRLKRETELHVAISQGHLFLEYQPIVALPTQDLIGYEALVRWQHGDETLYPEDFIPIAEETGMIGEIGQWVFGQACKKMLEESFGTDLTLSINLSCMQLLNLDLDLDTHLLKALEGYSDRLSQIQFEITETAMMPNIDEIKKALFDLAEKGVRFAIDDFGTGFSSLSYIKQLPISCLKIDKSFVADICTDINDKLIVKSIIDLAKNLQLGVVAEGVETLEQHEILLALGCQYAQGFYYGKPQSI